MSFENPAVVVLCIIAIMGILGSIIMRFEKAFQNSEGKLGFIANLSKYLRRKFNGFILAIPIIAIVAFLVVVFLDSIGVMHINW